MELRPKGPEYTVNTPEGLKTENERPWVELLGFVADAPIRNAQGQPVGWEPKLMRKRQRLTKALVALDDDATEITLEDGDVAEFALACTHMRWGRNSDWLVDFIDAVEAWPKDKEEEGS